LNNREEIQVGIGFATGRANFQQVLKTNVYNWQECGLTEREKVRLNLLVAYDLEYSNTKQTDYTNVSGDVLGLVDDTYFIGNAAIEKEIRFLAREGIVTPAEARTLFVGGYASKRNILLYTAMKNKMDCLLFLDDDEYPVAVTKTHSTAIWSGQHVLNTHLKNIRRADITNGYHCGYISPIPYIGFNDRLSESDFRLFIEAISNDIVSWDTIRSVMDSGGVTYADTDVLVNDSPQVVPEINRAKFISGSNLCVNLKNPERVLPFYNPPGARGEDTFLGTCLHDRTVLRVPCYTFHDGFSMYHHLMDGVLPIELKHIQANSKKIVSRFYRACVGWVRYKPLLLYITQRDEYERQIARMRDQLTLTLPKLCAYFNRNEFMNLMPELELYHKNVRKHYREFLETQRIWTKLTDSLFCDSREADRKAQ
jgi:hypothetical protein